jgi:hypothetical protein
MEIEKIFQDTILYQDLVTIIEYLDTFRSTDGEPKKLCILEKYKTSSPFWRYDEKTFWQFERVVNDEAERIKNKIGVGTRKTIGLNYLIEMVDDVISLLLEITQDTKAASIQSRCVVCYENEICVNVGPCGHFIICQSCSNRLSTCPLCRSPRK